MAWEFGLLDKLPKEIFDMVMDQYVYFDDEWLDWPDDSFNPEITPEGAFTGTPFRIRDIGLTELMSTNQKLRDHLTRRILSANTLRFNDVTMLYRFFLRLRGIHKQPILSLVRRLHLEIDIHNSRSRAKIWRLPSVLQEMGNELVGFSSKKTISNKPRSCPKVVLEFPNLDSFEIDFKIHSSRNRGQTNQRVDRHADDCWGDGEFCRFMQALARIKVKNPIITGLRSSHRTREIKESMIAIPEP